MLLYLYDNVKCLVHCIKWSHIYYYSYYYLCNFIVLLLLLIYYHYYYYYYIFYCYYYFCYYYYHYTTTSTTTTTTSFIIYYFYYYFFSSSDNKYYLTSFCDKSVACGKFLQFTLSIEVGWLYVSIKGVMIDSLDVKMLRWLDACMYVYGWILIDRWMDVLDA